MNASVKIIFGKYDESKVVIPIEILSMRPLNNDQIIKKAYSEYNVFVDNPTYKELMLDQAKDGLIAKDLRLRTHKTATVLPVKYFEHIFTNGDCYKSSDAEFRHALSTMAKHDNIAAYVVIPRI